MIRIHRSIGLLLASLSASLMAATPPDAATLMERSYQTTQIKGARADLTFELHAANGSDRVRKVSSVVRAQPGSGESSRLVRFEFPADAKGLATLLIEHAGRDDELWVYVPAIRKTRRLVADDKRDSFMGTVLSNADILGHKPAEWRHEITGEDAFEGHTCWHVVSTPASDAVKKTSGYSRRESCIDQDSAFNWRMDTWDEAGKPLKSIQNHRVQAIAQQPGVFQAYEIVARSLQDETSTRMTLDRFEFVANLPADDVAPTAMAEED